ncbi:MAG: hypothetical protein MJ016_01895 [Victivallaceae bacterium]|nr:hypothetical protein [Victivallaceae bacterium]
MIAVKVFIVLSLLLVLGKLIRVFVPLLQKLYLPSSIIGGFAGLIFFHFFPDLFPPEIFSAIGKLPGFLINVVFAALFMGAATPKISQVFRIAFPQLCFSQILSWGQYVLGLGITGFFLMKWFDVSPAFGNLLEIGFEGGHGTVGGMSAVFEKFNWEEGIALGYAVATCGIVLAITIGMLLVNWACRKGYVERVVPFSEMDPLRMKGVYRQKEQPSAGKQTVLCDSIDTLAWHCALLGIAIFLGYLMLTGCRQLEFFLLKGVKIQIFSGFPLFPFCMIGGVFIQLFFQKCRIAYLINGEQMTRISGASLDFLIVAALSTIRLETIWRNWLPLLILILAGTALSVCMVIFVAPRLFKTAWFERAIADFGQSLGVTATGLVLLRTVDPENKTEAAAAFGYKQLFHEPFMGGGLCTALALTMVFTVGWIPVFWISLGMLTFWGVITAILMVKNR